MNARVRPFAFLGALFAVAACTHAEETVPSDATPERPAVPVAPPPDAAHTPRVAPDGKDAFLAARAACDWLARHQSEDGAWNLRAPGGVCRDPRCASGDGPPDVVGDTSLALLAFLSARIDVGLIPPGAALKSGIERLVSAQTADGSFDASLAPHRVLDQALATQALFLMLTSTTHERVAAKRYGPAAKLALTRLLALRTPGAAWHDATLGSTSDLRVTTWVTIALAQARVAALDIPADVRHDVLAWLDTDPGGATEADAAMRTCCRVLLGTTQRDPHLAADYLILASFDADAPKTGRASDALGRYFVTVAESYWGGDMWARRRTSGFLALLPLQRDADDGCLCGSWDSVGAEAPEGDRVGATALTAMLFDAQYISSYANVMRARGPLIPK